MKQKLTLYLRLFNIIMLFVTMMTVGACIRPGGEFAFRSGIDDRYKKLGDTPQLNNTDSVEWCFQFSKKIANRKFGIVMLKKELVWVEVDARTEEVKNGRFLYGNIGKLPAGMYKIMILEKKTIIAEKEIEIYAGDEISNENKKPFTSTNPRGKIW